MNTPRSLTVVGVILCLAAFCVVSAQRSKLRELRSTFQAGEENVGAGQDVSGTRIAKSQEMSNDTSLVEARSASTELLRLRSQVSLLKMRKRELAGVEREGERLQREASAGPTNGTALPPGFVRKSEARFAGYLTPEATVESLFWAFYQKDLTNILRAFSPEVVQKIQQEAMSSSNFFSGIDAIPGFAIQSRSNAPDGTVELGVTIAPGIPAQNLRFQAIDGQWKVTSPGF